MADNDDKPMDETPAEQTEQRADDYDGLARRLDDMLAAMHNFESNFDKKIGVIMDTIKISDAAQPDAIVVEPDDTDAIDLETPIDDLDFSVR